jgi:hypothetical protein
MPTQARTVSTGERVVAAYRQAWLAGLGAAALTRDWLDTGAAPMLRTLVMEGTLVEAQAMRVVGARAESTYTLAGSAWRRARRGAGAAIRVARTRVPGALAQLPLPSRVAALVKPALSEIATSRPRKAQRVAPKTAARVAQKPRGKAPVAARRARKRA